MPDSVPAAADDAPLLGVMGAARVLGIATATLRSWDRRYGITPSVHTKGGHRRYNPQDMARLQAMGRMVREGVPPAEAARACLALTSEELGPPSAHYAAATAPEPVSAMPGSAMPVSAMPGSAMPGSAMPGSAMPESAGLFSPTVLPGAFTPQAAGDPDQPGSAASLGSVTGIASAAERRSAPVAPREENAISSLPMQGRYLRRPTLVAQQMSEPAAPALFGQEPAGSPERGLARAAAALDSAACVAILRRSLAAHGVVLTWDELVRPLLSRIGARWANSGVGVEVEHVLSASVSLTFTEHAHALVNTTSSAVSVVLASTPDEMHDIPMTVLAAALAEYGIFALHLGARTPGRALGDALTRVRPAVLVLWAQDSAHARVPALPAMRPAPALLLCGPGWSEQSAPPAVARDLSGALNRVGVMLGVGPLLRLPRVSAVSHL